jgi:SAM-dependent methyltransferase
MKTFTQTLKENKHSLSKDEKTLLIKYISWQQRNARTVEQAIQNLDLPSIFEYESLKDEILENSPKKIVDLGCGSGRSSFFFFMNLKKQLPRDTTFMLADYDRVADGYDITKPFFDKENFAGAQGYMRDNKFILPYNNFNVAKILKNIFCPTMNMEILNLDENKIQNLSQVDIVYSFASIGYHYSIATAFEEYNIKNILRSGGKFICDIQRAPSGPGHKKYEEEIEQVTQMGLKFKKLVDGRAPSRAACHLRDFYIFTK